MTAIVLVGMPGSGKEVFVEVAKELGFSVIRMGDVVREHARRSGLEMGDLSVGGHANSQRQEHGDDIWAVRTVEKLPDGDVIIDGSRSLHELEYFREHLEDMAVVAVDAPREVRMARLMKRGREDDPLRPEDFARREERELGWGIDRAISSADITIINDATLEDFRSHCRDILSRL